MACVRRCSIYRLLCRNEDGPTLPFCRRSRTLLLRRGKLRCLSKTLPHPLLPRTSLLLPKTLPHSLLPRTSHLLPKTRPLPLLAFACQRLWIRLLQLSSSKIPEKEHSAIESDKDPGNESGNTPLSALHAEGKARSSRTSLLGPWGDLDGEEETKSSNPPNIDGESTPLSALYAEDSQSFNRDPMASNFSNVRREEASVSERHRFKSPNSSSKLDGEASVGNNPGSGVTTDDEDA
jgi:hypothetical protein